MYIRSANDPVRDIGGRPPSKRPILAFFAGGMHGYLRPILQQYWKNKELDTKIFGPMARDIEGERIYREYMKSSKYCICARGYEVHTPRVVEAIFYECVPVIVSDNYVPPFFGTQNWEAFSVFVMEKDVRNLRNILLSIPEEEYLKMQREVKMVQQHFIWHKKPVKYDLFHMILHSVWHNKIFQLKNGSYELMERMLKVYVYKDGKKPIFHQPIMKGLYASEGWFMKLMEGNRQFVVKDPRKAHLFYMPFSSRMLEYTLYVRNSHNRTNLLQYLKEYTDKISAKYPFFNRTGGADHFLVACHDWAPYET